MPSLSLDQLLSLTGCVPSLSETMEEVKFHLNLNLNLNLNVKSRQTLGLHRSELRAYRKKNIRRKVQQLIRSLSLSLSV